jgi:hypothetical protein
MVVWEWWHRLNIYTGSGISLGGGRLPGGWGGFLVDGEQYPGFNIVYYILLASRQVVDGFLADGMASWQVGKQFSGVMYFNIFYLPASPWVVDGFPAGGAASW